MKQLLDTGHLRVSDVSGLLLVSGDRQSLRLSPDRGGGLVLSYVPSKLQKLCSTGAKPSKP